MIKQVNKQNDICSGIIDKHIPSRVINFRNKDKAWFIDECKRASQKKQDAYHLWMRNLTNYTWDNYTRLQAFAQAVYASTEKENNYNLKDNLLGATQSNK